MIKIKIGKRVANSKAVDGTIGIFCLNPPNRKPKTNKCKFNRRRPTLEICDKCPETKNCPIYEAFLWAHRRDPSKSSTAPTIKDTNQ